MVGLTLVLARDLSRWKIRANTVAPGIFGTPMANLLSDGVKKSIWNSQCYPDNRFGTPAECAIMVRFLLENQFMNAETVRIDAGTRMPKL